MNTLHAPCKPWKKTILIDLGLPLLKHLAKHAASHRANRRTHTDAVGSGRVLSGRCPHAAATACEQEGQLGTFHEGHIVIPGSDTLSVHLRKGAQRTIREITLRRRSLTTSTHWCQVQTHKLCTADAERCATWAARLVKGIDHRVHSLGQHGTAPRTACQARPRFLPALITAAAAVGCL